MIDDLFPEAKSKPEDDLDSRFTTRATLDWCMRAAGVDGFDLDAAACEESHHAPRWYSKADNGLEQQWAGRVWVNPPFSDLEPWVLKAWTATGPVLGCRLVAMLLPANRTEQPFWQKHVEPFRDGRSWLVPAGLDLGLQPEALVKSYPFLAAVKLDDWRFGAGAPELTTFHLPGRVAFGHKGNPEGLGAGSPPFGCVLLVWRRS